MRWAAALLRSSGGVCRLGEIRAGRRTRTVAVLLCAMGARSAALADLGGAVAAPGAALWVISTKATAKLINHGFRVVYHFHKPGFAPIPPWDTQGDKLTCGDE